MHSSLSPAAGKTALTNGWLQLRPWQTSDAPELVRAAHESFATVGQWLPWCHRDYDLADAAAWIEHCAAGRRSAEHFAFAVCDATTAELLGGVGLSQGHPIHHNANLGYWVRQSRQQQGIAVAAAILLARFGFAELGLARIEIVVLPENTASRATAEKLGARLEAVSRSRLWVNEQARDAVVYGLLPGDLVQPLASAPP